MLSHKVALSWSGKHPLNAAELKDNCRRFLRKIVKIPIETPLMKIYENYKVSFLLNIMCIYIRNVEKIKIESVKMAQY